MPERPAHRDFRPGVSGPPRGNFDGGQTELQGKQGGAVMGTTAQPPPAIKDLQGSSGRDPVLNDPLTGLTAKPASAERLMRGTVRPHAADNGYAARTLRRSANPVRLRSWSVGLLIGVSVTFLIFWFW